MKKIALVCIFVLLAGCLQQQVSLEEKINAIEEKNLQMKEYIVGQGFSRQVKELGIQEVQSMKKQEMFSDIPEKELVMVEYSHEQRGNFVVVIDMEKESVVKFLRIAGLALG